jgi:site-specific recombinase XerD
VTGPDLEALLPSWELHLRAERKAKPTIEMYTRGVRLYLKWRAAAGGELQLDRASVDGFVADLLSSGRQPATALAWQKGLRQFSKWLTAEGELPSDPLLGIRPPKLDDKVVPVLAGEQLRALVRACEGPTFRDRRDEALVRLLAETGIRAGEAIALKVADLDLAQGLAVVRRGKGGKGRVVPFGPVTARAVDRYLRLRRQHPRAAEAPLWLGDRGRGFLYDGLLRALGRRARMAGLQGFHPHQLRHTFASRWLAGGGSEGGLMAIAGWSRRDLVDRYVAATRSELAAEEARNLSLGDDL